MISIPAGGTIGGLLRLFQDAVRSENMWRKLVHWIFASAITVLVYSAFPEYHTFFKEHWANIVLATTALIGVFFGYYSYEQNKKLFPAQNKPLIDFNPFAIVFMKNEKGNEYATTNFSVINYSGFTAYDIGIDLQYGNGDWIASWSLADEDNKEKLKEIRGEKKTTQDEREVYFSYPISLIELKPKKRKKSHITGALNSEKVCSEGKRGLPVKVRAIWYNEIGYMFEEIKHYRLVCTKVGRGRHFTFMPVEAFWE